MDRLISRCKLRQSSQIQPGVCVREKRCSRCYPISLFYILILFLIIILPTKFLHASSTWQRTPTGPSHTQGLVEVSEPLRTQCWWHFDLYSVRGNAKFVSPMYIKTYPNAAILLRDCMHTRLVSQSQPHSPEQWNIFLRRTYAAPRS